MWPSDADLPGTYSDVFVRHPDTHFSNDENFIAYKTPSRSDYWWGAYLVSREEITNANLGLALREWEIRLGSLADIKKKIIQWEVPIDHFPTDAAELASVFDVPPESVSINSVLVATASTMPPHEPLSALTLEEARSGNDFDEIMRMSLADLESTPESPATEDFLRWKHGQFCNAVSNGEGKWWMLKHNGEFVANCGLFTCGQTARFREVTTHPRWRRHGFARALCHLVLVEGFKDSIIERVVIVAEHNSSAERIYKSVGFSPCSFQIALVWDLK